MRWGLLLASAQAVSGGPLRALRGGSSPSGRHSFSLSTFSPDGRLEQLEHALGACESAPPVVACIGLDCVVVVAVEPELGPLIEAAGTPKIMTVVSGAGDGCDDGPRNGCVVIAYAGLGGDARVLAAVAQKSGLQHWHALDEPMPVGLVAAGVAGACQEATQQGGSRPFGASLLVAGFGPGDPEVWQVDPSGWRAPLHAGAVGLDAPTLRVELAARWSPDLSAAELEDLVCDLLRSRFRVWGGTGEPQSGGLPAEEDEDGAELRKEERWRATRCVTVAVLRRGEALPKVRSRVC